MGRSFYTYDEAAKRLKRGKRSLLNYINKGMLNRVIQDGQHLLDKEDVEALAVDLGSDHPALNRSTVFKLMSRLNKLENEMRTVTHILEIKDESLRLDPVSAKGFYESVCNALTRSGKWVFEEVKLWASQLEKMDEVTLETFCLAINDNKAWAPFFRICREMEAYCDNRAKAEKDPKPYVEWMQLQKQLDNGRKKLRSSIIILVEMGRGISTEALLGIIDDPANSVIRNLGS